MFQKLIASIIFLFVLILLSLPVLAQELSSFDRQRNKEIISGVKSSVMEHYYDPTFKGLDLETKFSQVQEINKQAKSNSEVFTALAAVLMDLNDSHTSFIPPSRMNKVDYGWKMKAFGDKCLVSYVKSGSDAENKGLRVGDEVLALDRFKPSRQVLWKLNYIYNALIPREQVRMVAQSPEGKVKEMEIESKVTNGRRIDLTDYSESTKYIMQQEKEAELYAHRFSEFEKDLIIWRMPSFDLTKEKVDEYMNRLGKFKNVILDLRGNGGGAEETLLRMIGNFINKDLKIGDLVLRKSKKEMIAKTRGKDSVYEGNLFVLVDSDSGSSSEVFARVMQLEKRGTIIGDLTSGSVMRSRFYSKEVGVTVASFYGVSVTDADLIMTDGKSLERIGVSPDKLMLPSASDLARKHDVVLSSAASLASVTITPEKAGALFSKFEKK